MVAAATTSTDLRYRPKEALPWDPRAQGPHVSQTHTYRDAHRRICTHTRHGKVCVYLCPLMGTRHWSSAIPTLITPFRPQ